MNSEFRTPLGRCIAAWLSGRLPQRADVQAVLAERGPEEVERISRFHRSQTGK